MNVPLRFFLRFQTLPILLLVLSAGFVCTALAEDHALRVFSEPPGAVEKAKSRILANDPAVLPAYQELLKRADKALTLKPLSVLDKPKTPDSGDKHDYMSQAPYFWPDPTRPDGRPYIRKDGQRNPEAGDENSDSPRMGRMAGSSETLALAYYFSGREEYAEHAAKLLRTWFLDPATRMNPNLNYAQAVPGVNTGRGTGMIESRSLIAAIDAVGLLAGSKVWTAEDQTGLVTWIRSFLDWAQSSKNGKDEAAAKNNHGSHYDAQLAHFALFTGQTELAKSIVEGAKQRRIAQQIKPDGSQPLELSRADSFGYSRFNLLALFDLATIGEHVDVDLWHFETPDGAGIRKALDFLVPYVADPEKPWPYENGKKSTRDIVSLLWQAGAVYDDPHYRALVVDGPKRASDREALFFSLPKSP